MRHRMVTCLLVLLVLLIFVSGLCHAQSGPKPILSGSEKADRAGNNTARTTQLDREPLAGDQNTIREAHEVWKTTNKQFEDEFWSRYNLVLEATAGAKDSFCANAASYEQRIDRVCTGASGSHCGEGLQQLMEHWIDAKTSYYVDERVRSHKRKEHLDSLQADMDREEGECIEGLDDAQRQLAKHEEEKLHLKAESDKSPEDVDLKSALAKLDEIIKTDNDSIAYGDGCKKRIATQRINLQKMSGSRRQAEWIIESEIGLAKSQAQYFKAHYSMLWTTIDQLCGPPQPLSSGTLDGERPPEK